MGRPRRETAGDIAYHVLNRGNRRSRIFHQPSDYDAFLKALIEGLAVVPCRVLGLCLMPNHWHLVLWPHNDGDLSRLVGWVTNTHVKRYWQYRRDPAGGHLYQGRFKSFPVQEDEHLLTVLRYVEANPLRAQLCTRVQDWPWSSYALRETGSAKLLSPWPFPQPVDWGTLVEERWSQPELTNVRRSVNRGCPFGQRSWVERIVKLLGLQATLRPEGRPPLAKK